jgi:hypothetical protein
MVSRESASFVCFLMKSYWVKPSRGKPIMVSMTGSPIELAMKSSDLWQ